MFKLFGIMLSLYRFFLYNVPYFEQLLWYLARYINSSIQSLFSISNIPLSRTSLYLEHLFISNISLLRTFLYLEHPSILNIPLSRTSLYLEHLSTSNISLSRTSFYLYLKHLHISFFDEHLYHIYVFTPC